MPSKQFEIDESLTVTIHKRRSSKNIRLTVKPDGSAHVSIPFWAPYAAGVTFARARAEWIHNHAQPLGLLVEGQLIGRTHTLAFIERGPSFRLTARVLKDKIIVNYPSSMSLTDAAVQASAETAAEKALRTQAQAYLPGRLDALAAEHGFSYASMSVKKLKSRWGSCDSNKHIIFNIFLLQLEEHLIDYVILHELTHTEHLHHGPEFWARMQQICPQYKWLRKAVHAHKPVIHRT